MYLWCAERARLGCVALLTGLITNVILNTILLPRYGLVGAVWATGAANAVALVLIYRFNVWMGMKLQRSVVLVSLLPITLGFGPFAALAALTAVVLAAIFTNRVFDAAEKQRLVRARSWLQESNGMIELQDFPAILSRGNAADDRPLRVMFVITSMHVGGAETLLCNLIRRMDRERFAPELCCLKERGELGDQLSREILVHHDLLRRKYDLRVLLRLARLLRQRRTDIVVTVGAGDKMFWGRLAGRCASARGRIGDSLHKLAR